MDNIWIPFITGLTTGGLSCFAVQGGLLTSALATGGTGDVKYQKEKGIAMFLSAKLLAYTLLGAALGALGSTIAISIRFQGWLQIVVGLFMILTAARLLDIHPFFRYFVITPPKFVLRFMRKISVSDSTLVPAFLGFLTILVPCGVTQAMMLLAIASGSAILGAGIMFFFVLGTSPVFFLIGLAATTLLKNKIFAVVAAFFIFIVGILSVNSGQTLRGSVHTLKNYWTVLTNSQEQSVLGNEVNITVTSSGYKADINTLKVGVPVKLTLTTNGVKSCARAFTIPALNISKILPETGAVEVEFTPTKTGLLTYTCSMGMYSGTFNVVQ
ncbi:MAG TPA: sulfite exporter TauE/SafE family protein [Patescibacteria group bacterium]|nr:sulfite exporter TauE/SafE family protein [Patescibacteria group bacterium]